MIKAIVFDLDDTLYPQEVPFTKAIKKVFPQLIKEELTDFFKLFRTISDELYEQTKQKNGITKSEMTTLRLTKAIEESFDLQVTESLIAFFESEYNRQLNQIRLSDSLKEVLQKLAEKYKLGIITNGYIQRQELKIEVLKVRDIISPENILISEKIGIEKPDRRIFDQMAKVLVCEPRELLYIGDNYKNDIVGAKRAGWHAWWFNHHQRRIPEEIIEIPDKEIRHFGKLAEELSLLVE